MRFFVRSCEQREAAYLAGSGRLTLGERLDLERHAAVCGECADALRNVRPVDRALSTAFAPLRERHTIIAPGRVRMALGYEKPVAKWLRLPRIFGRIAEATVMVGVTMFVVGSALVDTATQQPVPTAERSVVDAYFRAQPPFD